MGLFEATQEKIKDIRVLERAKHMAKLDEAMAKSFAQGLADDESNAVWVNLEELNAKDNPVHVARNLPTPESLAPKNIEDLEFESEEGASGRGIEQ